MSKLKTLHELNCSEEVRLADTEGQIMSTPSKDIVEAEQFSVSPIAKMTNSSTNTPIYVNMSRNRSLSEAAVHNKSYILDKPIDSESMD